LSARAPLILPAGGAGALDQFFSSKEGEEFLSSLQDGDDTLERRRLPSPASLWAINRSAFAATKARIEAQLKAAFPKQGS